MLISALSYILRFFMAIVPSQLNCSCDQPNSEFSTGVNLLYYKCNNETPATIPYPITAPEKMLDKLEKDKRTIFYIFGYLESPEVDNVKLMMKALCYGETDNVVLLDWSKHSSGLYNAVVSNAKKVGSLFAESIRKLEKSGLDISKIYIIGHSLGAHIASLAGKCNKDFKLPRITVLDPANPNFDIFGCYINNMDASFIDVIHTDKAWLGLLGYGSDFQGTAEFFANTGSRFQPGCPGLSLATLMPLSDKDLCSHQKSVKIYAISKICPAKLIAVQCSSHSDYINNKCNDNKRSGIGYAAAPNVTGSFYFSTEHFNFSSNDCLI